MHYGDFIRQQM